MRMHPDMPRMQQYHRILVLGNCARISVKSSVAISNLHFLCSFCVQAYLYKKITAVPSPQRFKESRLYADLYKFYSAKIGQVFPEIELFQSLQRANAIYLLLGKIFTRASMGIRGTDHYQFALSNQQPQLHKVALCICY